jgi:hypothetical protein
LADDRAPQPNPAKIPISLIKPMSRGPKASPRLLRIFAVEFYGKEKEKMSIRKKNHIPIILCGIFLMSCVYIVTPVMDVTPTSTSSKGWTAMVTNVGKSSAGDLHIDIAIRNETGDWSAMQAAANHPAVLTSGGKNSNCDTVVIGTGGHRLAPGFQMRGYTGGTKASPEIQLLYVECKGATADPGSKLTIDYGYINGVFNYYVPSTAFNTKLELNLDQVAAGLTYPVAESIPDLVLKPGDKIEAINSCTITLADAQRTDTGLEFSWETDNPGTYPTYVHIGIPPVIGSDGVIYGVYESPNLEDAPITLPGQKADWKTNVAVPKDVTNLYILLSVEEKQQKNFWNHLIDITAK